MSRNPDIIKNLFENHFVIEIVMLEQINKDDAPLIFKSVRFPKLRYSSKYFAQIYRDQYGAAMLMYLRGTPTLRPENSVNIWNLAAEVTSIVVLLIFF